MSDSGEWTRVRYGGHDGYVMSKFITTDATAQPDPMPPDVVDVDRAALIAEGRGLLKRLGAIWTTYHKEIRTWKVLIQSQRCGTK